MTTRAGAEQAGADPAPLQAQIASLVASLAADWSVLQAEDGPDGATERTDAHGVDGARRRCAQALLDLMRLLGPVPGGASWVSAEASDMGEHSGSLLASLQALHALLEDPMASLPGDVGTALVLTQERLADLRLQQLLAAEDPNWSSALLQPRDAASMLNSLSVSTPPPDEPPASPEMQQAGRDWWAIPIEGLTGSNQMFLLETRELLRSAELSLRALEAEPGDYGEQMVLCRSFQAVSVAAASMGLHRVAKIAAEGEARFDGLLDRGGICDAANLHATDGLLSGLFRELMELVGEPVVQAPAEVPQSEAPAEVPQPEAPTEVLPPEAPAEVPQAEPEQPPWWWAMDWSSWEPNANTSPQSLTGAEASVPAPYSTAIPQAQEAHVAQETLLRIPAAQLRGWSERLRARGHEASVRQALLGELEDAACVPVESWSVSLFRTARRVARNAGQTVDFDIEGASARADAALMQHLMPRLEDWVGLRVAQSLGQALRLKATHEGAALRLHLGDGHAHPWPERVVSEMQDMAAWLAARGGAVRPDASGWQFILPVIASRVPLLAVRCGSFEAHVPALWVGSQQAFDSPAHAQALEVGSVEHEGVTWPVAQLAALLRQEPAEQASAQLLWIQQGQHRLALIVDHVEGVVEARPLHWPAALLGLKGRSGLWGLAAGEAERLAIVIDPFALHDRFGAAARVLARTRLRRAPR